MCVCVRVRARVVVAIIYMTFLTRLGAPLKCEALAAPPSARLAQAIWRLTGQGREEGGMFALSFSAKQATFPRHRLVHPGQQMLDQPW